jgi:hypothetical protein
MSKKATQPRAAQQLRHTTRGDRNRRGLFMTSAEKDMGTVLRRHGADLCDSVSR